jgi:hypothetical protein
MPSDAWALLYAWHYGRKGGRPGLAGGTCVRDLTAGEAAAYLQLYYRWSRRSFRVANITLPSKAIPRPWRTAITWISPPGRCIGKPPSPI